MRKKRLAIGATIALTWIGSLWMVFWSGFNCDLLVTVTRNQLDDKARLIEHEWLLQKIDSGQVKSVRQTLADSVKLDKEIIDIDKRIPSLGPLDIVLAGIRNPREDIVLIQSANAIEARSLAQPKK